MGVTHWIQYSDVRHRFRETFALPRVAVVGPLRVPPRSPRAWLIGTAFHYLLSWMVWRLNPHAIRSPSRAEQYADREARWLAMANDWRERAARAATAKEAAQWSSLAEAYRPGSTLRIVAEHAPAIVQHAQAAVADYCATGVVRDALLVSALQMAWLDWPVGLRRMSPTEALTWVTAVVPAVAPEDVEELRDLLAIVDPAVFTTRQTCLIHPSAPEIDLVLDHLLLEIKTSRERHIPVETWYQLIAYYAIATIHGIAGVPQSPTITALGVYLARFGVLYRLPLDQLASSATWASFLNWMRLHSDGGASPEPSASADGVRQMSFADAPSSSFTRPR